MGTEEGLMPIRKEFIKSPFFYKKDCSSGLICDAGEEVHFCCAFLRAPIFIVILPDLYRCK